jgi:hypothetical protein
LPHSSPSPPQACIDHAPPTGSDKKPNTKGFLKIKERKKAGKMMGDGGVKQMLAKPIQLADQVTKWADDAHYFRQECAELKTKTERLVSLLRQAARADLYERPARRIMVDTEQVRKCFFFPFV